MVAAGVRVHFEGGQTAEVECNFYDLSIVTVGQPSGIEPYQLSAGVLVPVRYDPSNRAKVEIDRPKIIADTISAYDADRAKKIERPDRAACGRRRSTPAGQGDRRGLPLRPTHARPD